MAQTAPTRGATETGTATWAGQPAVATALRVLVFAVPVLASWLTTRLLASTYWRPDGPFGLVMWFAQLVVVGSTVVLLAGRSARRLLPLAALYNLTIVFPDHAPSRFRVALRSGNVRAMQTQFADVRANGFADDRSQAMAQILELIAALSRHEPRTRGHTDRVRAYVEILGEEMGLSAGERDKLRWAAMMHDIGKLAVPAEILNKAGKPTDEEWATLMSHPVVGGEMVEPLKDWLGEWRHAASQHHERWDGTGYPARLAGEQISLAGRIVAVADAYDVITSARSYKKPMSADSARRELVRCAGTQFDPTVVRAFLQASIGHKPSRTGALGWLLEVPRAVGSMASQAATAAGAVVTAGSIAVASVAVAAPPEPPRDDVVAASDVATSSGRAMVASAVVAKGRAATGATAAAGNRSTTSSGPTGATGSTGTTGATNRAGSTTTTIDGPRTSGAAVEAPVVPSTTAGDPSTASTTPPGVAPTSTTTTTALGPCSRLNSGTTQLAGADLAGCVVTRRGTINGVDLRGANLRGANLNGARFAGGTMAGADFTGASLNGTRLTSVDLSAVLFDGADLTGSRFEQDDLHDAVITGAKLSGSRWTDDDLTHVTFAGSTGGPSQSSGNTWSATTCPSGIVRSTACF